MKRKPFLNKIAAFLAFAIGIMAVFAGGQVFIGILPDYYIIEWLPVYNFVIGIASAFFTAVVLWKNNHLALPAAVTTLGLHSIVMIILQTAYRNVVAPDSIKATTVRLVIWILILTLMIFQKRKEFTN